MSGAGSSALYEGHVWHARVTGPRRRFRYRIYMLALDLGELGSLDAELRLFGYNRRRPVAFFDRDHLGGEDRPLRESVAEVLAGAGMAEPLGRVVLLTHCRVFGYVFNPVSFFYCYDREGALRAVIAEVDNTFGDRHPYVLTSPGADRVWTEKKLMHVSPFFPLEGSYRWEVPEPSERLRIRVDLTRCGRDRLRAGLALRRRPLGDRTLLGALVRYPLMTVTVIAAIHWQALRLWLGGAPFWSRPPYDPEAARGGPS